MKKSRWLLLAGLAVTSAIVLPVVAYVVGGRVAGPYAGSRGLASFLGAMYDDALSGRPLAVTVLTAPLLCVIVWDLRGKLMRRLDARRPPAAQSRDTED